MTAFTGRTPGSSYREILKISNTGIGLDATLRAVEDGAGNASPLKLSQTAFSLYDLVWPADTQPATGYLLRVGANSQLVWAPITTSDIGEGSGNEYFTVERARASVSASGSITYNQSTGVFSYTEAVHTVAGRAGDVVLTKSDVGLSVVENKTSATIRGEITNANVVAGLGYTPLNVAGDVLLGTINANSYSIFNLPNPSNDSEAATKIYVDTLTTNDTTIVRTSGDQVIAGQKIFSDDMTISGNLTVTGSTITVNSQTVLINDNIIELNSNFTSGTPTANTGIQALRGDAGMVQFIWDESNERFSMHTLSQTNVKTLVPLVVSAVTATTFTGALVGNASTATKLATARTINGVAFDGSANISFSTSAVAEGTNLYFTTARASAAAPIQTVAGRTGDVVLTVADVTGAAAINPTTPKDGDVRVVGSVISIYASGAWRQVFPAVYS